MRAVTNEPGASASGRCTMRFVRVRAWVERPASAAALDEHLDDVARPCAAVALERDAFLERHEPVEPLLHDLLRDLLVEASRPACRGAGEYWNM